MMTEQQEDVVHSNVASSVGRHISIRGGSGASKRGIIIAYNPTSNQHTVRFEIDGTEEAFTMNKERFKWLVRGCEAADEQGYKSRLHEAVLREAVGRKLEVYSKKRGKWFAGTIVKFNENNEKHKIRFANANEEKDLKLSKHQWRFTDLIGRYHQNHGSQWLGTSRYVGVKRSSEFTWAAFMENASKYIGSFKSEQDAALAHDFYARKLGGSINLPDQRIGQDEISLRQEKQYSDDVTLPTSGKSKYRGVSWQKNRKRWMARYTLAHKGRKEHQPGFIQ